MMRTTRQARRGKAKRMTAEAYDPKLLAERVTLVLKVRWEDSARKWGSAARVSDTTISKLSRGEGNPELRTLSKMAKATGITVSQLIGETPLDDPDAVKLPPDEGVIRAAQDLRSKISDHSADLERLHQDIGALIRSLKEP